MFHYQYTFILIVPALLFALACQWSMKSNYKKYSAISNKRGLTGAAAAQQLLKNNGITDVAIEMVNGKLTDHFDPRGKVIRLSQDVYNGTSIAAVGVACHEAGHACQYNENYFPMKIRAAIIPITNLGSILGFPLAIFGYFFSFGILVDIGLILYACVAVFQFITLPVEFNASKRALATIETYGMLDDEEYKGAKKVLTAAAMTYVAALASAIAQLLRLILITNRE